MEFKPLGCRWAPTILRQAWIGQRARGQNWKIMHRGRLSRVSGAKRSLVRKKARWHRRTSVVVFALRRCRWLAYFGLSVPSPLYRWAEFRTVNRVNTSSECSLLARATDRKKQPDTFTVSSLRILRKCHFVYRTFVHPVTRTSWLAITWRARYTWHLMFPGLHPAARWAQV